MKIKILLIFCLFFNCKKAESQTISKNSKSSISHIPSVKNPSCEEVIRQIVISSNLDLSVYKGNYQINIEEITSNIVKIHVFTENNLSDDPAQKQIVESTIAWLEYDHNQQKLSNITADPDNPVALSYNKKLSQNDIFFKICGISKINPEIHKDKFTNTDCKKISGEMMSGEECILKNIQIEDVYHDIIKGQLVDDSNYLLKDLPIENRNIDINKNSLMKIDYSINDKKVDINFEYEGGETEIKLEQINNDVKRAIIYGAD